MAPLPDRFSRGTPIVVFIAASAGLFLGWKLFWFLTDDAYIAFRYVSNSLAGHGYVWNPPPFRPVEGYTSFLWVWMLDVVWRVFKVPPPAAANWMSLVFAWLNLALIAAIVYRLSWPERLKNWKALFLALCFAFVLTNRSFLAWASSGLETALFCVLITAWVYSCLYASPRRRLLLVSLSASLLTLTRPDGLLFVAASLALFVAAIAADGRKNVRTTFLSALPFSIVVGHLIWRRFTYGEWLPNTYYAKSVSMWPESGIRYLWSFFLEFGLWLWAAILVVAAVTSFKMRRGRSNRRARTGAASGPAWKRLASARRFSLVIVVAALVLHIGYYTFAVGGDHFEYRVYNHFIPFLFISFLFALFKLGRSVRVTAALAVLMILVSLPVQWTHWALTRGLDTRKDTYVMVVPIADSWPAPIRWYASLFDKAQGWLIPHHVCMRHQEHKIFHQFMVGEYPDRADGSRIDGAGFPVYLCTTVGVPSWTLPHINILDKFGLNDYVIARMPVSESQFRMMAHDRRAPAEYIDGFSPNVEIENGTVVIAPRAQPLTAERIEAHESYWWKAVKEGTAASRSRPNQRR